jgi:hypothetical protein
MAWQHGCRRIAALQVPRLASFATARTYCLRRSSIKREKYNEKKWKTQIGAQQRRDARRYRKVDWIHYRQNCCPDRRREKNIENAKDRQKTSLEKNMIALPRAFSSSRRTWSNHCQCDNLTIASGANGFSPNTYLIPMRYPFSRMAYRSWKLFMVAAAFFPAPGGSNRSRKAETARA